MEWKIYSKRDLKLAVMVSVFLGILSVALVVLGGEISTISINGEKISRSDPRFMNALSLFRGVFSFVGMLWFAAAYYFWRRLRSHNVTRPPTINARSERP
jgi:hypothetical protein